MFGMMAKNRRGKVEGYARKRTRFLTNSYWIAQELNRRCEGNHAHVPLLDGKAGAAAIYPVELCRAICRGLLREKKERVLQVKAIVQIDPIGKGKKLPSKEDHHDGEEASREAEIGAKYDVEAWDDVSGVKLDAKQVMKARNEEIGWFKKKGVYQKIPRAEAIKNGWTILRVRWIDINKGDGEAPVHRSRLLAEEFRANSPEGEMM